MKKPLILVIALWLSTVIFMLFWNLRQSDRAHQNTALQTARAFFQEIVITRQWNARHGGVYVPVTEYTQPNPHLEDPLRDVETTDGLRLTKINPAFMTRQIAELAVRSNLGVRYHITSLKPIRPENRAADWETNWLRRFEDGTQEISAFANVDQQPVFRYMAPLSVKQACLECHRKQGYQLGDIRGGISVTLPYQVRESPVPLVLGFSGAGLGGVLLILVGAFLIHRDRKVILETQSILKEEIRPKDKVIQELETANTQVKALSGIVPICMHCKGIRDDNGYWNQLESFMLKHAGTRFSHGICDSCLEKLE